MTTRGNSAPGVQTNCPQNAASKYVECPVAEQFEAFDAMSPAHRKVLREADFLVDVRGLDRFEPWQIRAVLAKITRESALATYGPDHPQAGRSR